MTYVPIVLVTYDTRSVLSRLDRNRLINNSAKLLIIAHFNVPRNREVFAERIANKPVISKNSAQIWMASMADFAEMNAVWDAWVAQGHAPARATGESALATPDYKVEIIVVAAQN